MLVPSIFYLSASLDFQWQLCLNEAGQSAASVWRFLHSPTSESGRAGCLGRKSLISQTFAGRQSANLSKKNEDAVRGERTNPLSCPFAHSAQHTSRQHISEKAKNALVFWHRYCQDAQLHRKRVMRSD